MLGVIRIKGQGGTRKEIEDTLKMLRLDTINSCTIVLETSDFKGMIEKCRDMCTWGEIDKDTLVAMLRKRLRFTGEKRIDENNLKKITGNTFESFADSLLEGKVKLNNFKEFQPFFKLTPPSKGFKSLREYYPKGDLGYRGKEINELVKRMI
jgi:large subunit ribosomal protein L30